MVVVIVGDESGLRCLVERLAPYMPAPMATIEPARWLTRRRAAEYAGTMTSALHKPTAAHEISSSRIRRGAKGWLKRADVDAWRAASAPEV